MRTIRLVGPRYGWALVAAAVIVLAGCGTEPDAAVEPGSVSGSPPGDHHQTDSPLGKPTACAQLIREGWTAPETEPNINYDNEADVAVVEFTDPEDTIVVSPRSDLDCHKLDDIGPLLARIGPNQDEITEELCADAVKSANAGRPPARNGMKMDLESLREMVRQDCPPKYVKQLN